MSEGAVVSVASTIPPPTRAYFDEDELRCRVFLDKYALKDPDGKPLETLPEEMWRRVAGAIASVETDPDVRRRREEEFTWLLEDFRSIPGGRILFGAGNPRRATLLNCYVVPIREDSLEGLFDWCKEAARTYSLGGGVGTDVSLLRPKGAPVNNAAVRSSGAASFLNLLSTVTGSIGQSGRRGALMLTMRDSHPDILDFCKAKRDLKSVRYANLSVKLSDEFLRAVEEDRDFNLSFESEKASMYRTIPARELWEELIQGARDWGEPGVLFWDSVRRESTSEYSGMEVVSTNPCSEIPLEGYGDCCLGNINLARFVSAGFTPAATVDWENLEKALRIMVRFLDDVLDYNMERHPLPQQAEASRRSRRIGVGFTGLADMFCLLRLKYDTDEAVAFADALFQKIKVAVYDESSNRAAEKGPFPLFDAEKHMASPFIQRLPQALQEKIRRQGLRNVALLTVPPVGSGAALAGVTSGIEPIFDLSYVRRTESLSQGEFKVFHPLVKAYLAQKGLSDESQLPEYFVTAHRISPEKRVQMQAAIQKHIDHAISSTINLAREATTDDVKRIFLSAWKAGCKGMTVYREGSREGVLISAEEAKRTAETGLMVPAPRMRPKVTEGRTERIETPRGPVYVTVNEDEMGLCEVFVKSLDAEAECTGRLVSLLLRAQVDPREVIEQLWRVRSREVAFDRSTDGTTVRVTTVSQAVGLVVGRHLYGESFNPDKVFPRAATLPAPVRGARQKLLKFSSAVAAPKSSPPPAGGSGLLWREFAGVCPDCGDSLARENGCATCRSCGFSKCG